MRKSYIEVGHPQLSVRRQSELLNVNRNRLSQTARKTTPEEMALCLEIDKLYLKRPYYGARRIAVELQSRGLAIGRGRCRRLMRKMGLVAIYPKPQTSIKSPENRVYPCLLRDLEIERSNQVWCSDITYIPMKRGFAYLVVIMDWYSRAVLGWRISNTLDTDFCLEALKDAEVKISMDGKRRWIDNVMVERLWRSLKYEDIYLHEYLDLAHLERGVGTWLDFYNNDRRHQSLGNETPWKVWKTGSHSLAA